VEIARTYFVNTRYPSVQYCTECGAAGKIRYFVQNVVRSGVFLMDTNEKQIALSVLESLRADLMYAHLKNGSRILDVADLRQYIYEMMSRIRTNRPLNV